MLLPCRYTEVDCFLSILIILLQVEYQNLVDHVEQGMAEVAAQMAEAEAKKFDRLRQELEVALTEKVRLSSLLNKLS